VSFGVSVFSRDVIFTFVFISSLPSKDMFLSDPIFVNLAPANFIFVMLIFDKFSL